MYGLNSRSKIVATVQIANAVAFSVAAYDLCTNPETKFSIAAMDMLIHAMSYVNLGDTGSKTALTLGSYTMNCFSLGGIYSSGMNLGFFDLMTHVVNLPVALQCTEDSERPESFM